MIGAYRINKYVEIYMGKKLFHENSIVRGCSAILWEGKRTAAAVFFGDAQAVSRSGSSSFSLSKRANRIARSAEVKKLVPRLIPPTIIKRPIGLPSTRGKAGGAALCWSIWFFNSSHDLIIICHLWERERERERCQLNNARHLAWACVFN